MSPASPRRVRDRDARVDLVRSSRVRSERAVAPVVAPSARVEEQRVDFAPPGFRRESPRGVVAGRLREPETRGDSGMRRRPRGNARGARRVARGDREPPRTSRRVRVALARRFLREPDFQISVVVRKSRATRTSRRESVRASRRAVVPAPRRFDSRGGSLREPNRRRAVVARGVAVALAAGPAREPDRVAAPPSSLGSANVSARTTRRGTRTRRFARRSSRTRTRSARSASPSRRSRNDGWNSRTPRRGAACRRAKTVASSVSTSPRFRTKRFADARRRRLENSPRSRRFDWIRTVSWSCAPRLAR